MRIKIADLTCENMNYYLKGQLTVIINDIDSNYINVLLPNIIHRNNHQFIPIHSNVTGI